MINQCWSFIIVQKWPGLRNWKGGAAHDVNLKLFKG